MNGLHKASPGISEWHGFFFARGPQLNWALWPGQRGHIPIRRGQHSLSISLIVFNTARFCHHTQSFGNVTKKKKKKKTPSGENSHREPDWPWATAHVVASNNSFSLNWLVFTTPVWLNIWVTYIREVGGGEWILNDSQVAGLADNPCSPSCK